MSGLGELGAPAGRRTTADPVKALLHRHRELCERAVDPLEIAAGLEAHGITDRAAARFRHRDVFSLAEEMYARVPHGGAETGQVPSKHLPHGPAGQLGVTQFAWVLVSLLPGALVTATLTGAHRTHGTARAGVLAAGVLALALAVRAVLRHGPLSRRSRTHPVPCRTAPAALWLLAYAALGDGLLRAALSGGPDGPPALTPNTGWPVDAAPLLTLALACAPAAGCAHLLAVRARRRLHASRGLEEFAVAVRPLLLGTLALYAGVLAALTALGGASLNEPAAYARVVPLGLLLLLARLLTTHGFTHAPAVVLTAAAAAEALAPASVLAGRLPGCGALSVPVETLTAAGGPGTVPALVCGAAALTLLIHATRTLTRASAHARTDTPC